MEKITEYVRSAPQEEQEKVFLPFMAAYSLQEGGIWKEIDGEPNTSNLGPHAILELMQPPACASSQGSGEQSSALGPEGLQIGVADEILARRGLV